MNNEQNTKDMAGMLKTSVNAHAMNTLITEGKEKAVAKQLDKFKREFDKLDKMFGDIIDDPAYEKSFAGIPANLIADSLNTIEELIEDMDIF